MMNEDAKPYLKAGMTIDITNAEDKGKNCCGSQKLTGSTCKENTEFHTDKGHWVRPGDELEILTNPDGSKWVHPDQEKTEFKVGDRVKIVSTSRSTCSADIGATGTLISIIDGFPTHGVEFDEPISGGHTCDGLAKDQFGYYLHPNELEKIEEPKTVMGMKSESMFSVPTDFYRIPPMDFWSKSPAENMVVKYYYGVDLASEPKKGKIMSAVNFVKEQALKLNNPDEYELRKAGLHNDCGELTNEGEELRDQFLEELVKEKLVETARAINEEKKSKK
jgi:hypothetical protein